MQCPRPSAGAGRPGAWFSLASRNRLSLNQPALALQRLRESLPRQRALHLLHGYSEQPGAVHHAPNRPPVTEIDRLAAILARLQSPYEGEIINVANAATRFLASHGIDSDDLAGLFTVHRPATRKLIARRVGDSDDAPEGGAAA